jgi:hypothetical protein
VSTQAPPAHAPERHWLPAAHGSPGLRSPVAGRPTLAADRQNPKAAPSGIQQTNPRSGSQSLELQHPRAQNLALSMPTRTGSRQKSPTAQSTS